MTYSAQATFEFSYQQLPELLVSCALVTALRKVLPADCQLRLLPKEEQAKGDLEVVYQGQTRYIEIKIEAYPATLFLEPFQMWAQAGDLRFKRSWAFTTTADAMLYIGPRHTHGLLVPRRAWLKTGLELMEAAMLASAKQRAIFTPNLSLNSRPNRQGGRKFTGAAAGVALGVGAWMTAFSEAYDNAQPLLAEFGEFMPSVIELAQSCEQNPAPVNAILEEVGVSCTAVAALRGLARWADRARVGGAWLQNGVRDVHNTWQRLSGGSALLSPEQAFNAWLSTPLTEDSTLPVEHPAQFLAHACFESSWANGGSSDNIEDLLAQATQLRLLPQPGQEDVWPRAVERECYLRTYGSKKSHGACPPPELVLEQWRARGDTARRNELMRCYLAPTRLA